MFYRLTEGLRRAAATKTGPNDVRHVVWAFGKSFFFLLFSIDTKCYYSYYQCPTGLRRAYGGRW